MTEHDPTPCPPPRDAERGDPYPLMGDAVGIDSPGPKAAHGDDPQNLEVRLDLPRPSARRRPPSPLRGEGDRGWGRRRFLQAAAASALTLGLPWREAEAIGPSSRMKVATLRYQGGKWNPRPNGLRKMLQELEKRTSIAVDPQPVDIAPEDKRRLFKHPLLFWLGEGGFDPLSETAVTNLGLYLRAGGTIVIDSADAALSGPFEKAVRREMARILPGRAFVEIPRSHVLYKSFYLIGDPVGRVAIASSMKGIFGEDRAMVLMNHNDMLGAWSRDNLGNYDFDVFPGGERQRDMSYRLGINIVMYTLCLNYKEDQVHVPFILKRRKWKID